MSTHKRCKVHELCIIDIIITHNNTGVFEFRQSDLEIGSGTVNRSLDFSLESKKRKEKGSDREDQILRGWILSNEGKR